MAENIEFNLPNSLKELKARLASFIWIIVAILVLIAGFTMFYTIQAESQGVVLRFGKYIKTVNPGLHVKVPFGIDTYEIVQVERQLKQEFGFATSGSTNRSQYNPSSAEREHERNMVTGDLNAATVEWIVQYRVEEPQSFLFKVREPQDTLRDISESVMRLSLIHI